VKREWEWLFFNPLLGPLAFFFGAALTSSATDRPVSAWKFYVGAALILIVMVVGFFARRTRHKAAMHRRHRSSSDGSTHQVFSDDPGA
jgi:hypothetical protein